MILKNGDKWNFSYETKALFRLSQWREWVYGVKSWEKRRLLWESAFIWIARQTLIHKMVEREAFLMNPKHQCHLSKWVEWAYGIE